jgi:ClpP class serine protease
LQFQIHDVCHDWGDRLDVQVPLENNEEAVQLAKGRVCTSSTTVENGLVSSLKAAVYAAKKQLMLQKAVHAAWLVILLVNI